MELHDSTTSIRFGQIPAPLLKFVPVSVAHNTSFPLGFGSAGVIGIYYPGVQVSETFNVGPKTKATILGAILQGAWKGTGLPGSTTIIVDTDISPQLEARFDLTHSNDNGMDWEVFIAGHLDQKDLSGVSSQGSANKSEKLTGWAVEAGAKLEAGGLTLHGSGYAGHAIGQQFAQIIQFGDIYGVAGWAQAGYNLNKHWSVWTFYGTSNQTADDSEDNLIRPRHWTFAPMLKWSEGPLAVGLEWMYMETFYKTANNAGSGELVRTGSQVSLSTLLKF